MPETRVGASVSVYDTNGLVSNPKLWSGVANTDSNGAWAVDYSSAGFTAPPRVQATAVGPGASASAARNAGLSSAPTATTAAGIVTSPATISILGLLTVNLVSAGVPVHVVAIGS